MSTQKVLVAAGIVSLFAIVLVLQFSQKRSENPDTFTGIGTASTTTAAKARFVPDSWKEYKNTAYRFSLLYPAELEIKEYPEGGNALTVTFQNAKEQKGFQLFIVPYQEKQVSEERFKQDLPSGVRTDVTDLNIDGATAAAFYSTSATLGETREIWFIHNDFLFEVTAPKFLEQWLHDTVRTWQFL